MTRTEPGRTACVDFGGVLHDYQGWDGNPPKGRPTEGAHLGLFTLQAAGYRVVIHTSRSAEHVRNWLRRNDLQDMVDLVTNVKVPADVYFDDRAWHVPSNVPMGLVTAVRQFLERGLPNPTRAALAATVKR